LLDVEPGPAGQAAALLGDAAAAAVVTSAPGDLRLLDLELTVDGANADLIRVQHSGRGVELHIEGTRLAAAAIAAMAQQSRTILTRHHLAAGDLAAVVMHAGNARFPLSWRAS
jgi:3-oxoacyl-[acyl-carrier-protein] synthase III